MSLLLARPARAAGGFAGPYVLHMHATGGWDPTLLCDAKTSGPKFQNQLVSTVARVNGVPVPESRGSDPFSLRYRGHDVESPRDFFERFGQKFLVINGLDTQTSNHATGVRMTGCGHSTANLPALAALYAGHVARTQRVPMSFLASGAYDQTGLAVVASRFPSGIIPYLARPNQFPDALAPLLLPEAVRTRIQASRKARMGALVAGARLPRTQRTMAAFQGAAVGGDDGGLLERLESIANPSFASLEADLFAPSRSYLSDNTNPGNPDAPRRVVAIAQPIENILRCFSAGVSASATYAESGFDTHAAHDTAHEGALALFLLKVRYALLRAKQLGIGDKLVLLVTSDFGRTPTYNADAGKDHWNLTSALLSGPGLTGGRVLGATDGNFSGTRVLRSDAAQVVADDDARGTRLRMEHLHRDLRRYLKIEEFSAPYALPEIPADETFRLF